MTTPDPATIVAAHPALAHYSTRGWRCLGCDEEILAVGGDYAEGWHRHLAQKAIEAALEEYHALLTRQGDLLTGVANALQGDPPPLTTWSHHDLPERAAAAVEPSRDKIERAARAAHVRLMWTRQVSGYGHSWDRLSDEERAGWIEYAREIVHEATREGAATHGTTYASRYSPTWGAPAEIPTGSDVIERAARVLTEALFKRSPYLSADQNDASKSDLYAQLRDSWVPTLAAAGLLTPSDAFASTKPSDADVAERIAQAWEEGHSWGWSDAKEAHEIHVRYPIREDWPLRTPNPHATPPVAATGEEVDHYPMSAISMRGTSAVCDWCGQVFESSDLYREHERVMVLARRAREAAATGEGG